MVCSQNAHVLAGTPAIHDFRHPPAATAGELALRVLDHTPAMVAYWGADLICRFSNAAYADWFGKSRAAMTNIAMADALGPLFAQNREQIVGVLEGNKQVFERAVVVADGSLRHSLMTYTPDIVDGQVQGFFVHVGDVSPLKQAEHALRSSNASLQATQILLADAIRSTERTRIARDLHDALGHQLTALKVNLELASRQLGASAPLDDARTLAKNLLAQVRQIVAMERGHHVADLHKALASLCAAIPAPTVTIVLAEEVEIYCPALAHTVFCCVQETLTNAMRHAHAQQVQVHLLSAPGGISLVMGDDGRGAPEQHEGNGLRGMRERVAGHAGKMSVSSQAGEGFHIQIWLPQRAEPL